jgi:hypothetical protein
MTTRFAHRASPPRRDDRGGFAIAAVVFMLAAVMLLMATGYDLVRLLGDVRGSARDGMMAEQAADAVVDRFMGERIGTPPDSEVVRLTETTTVRVRARRLARLAGHRSSYVLVGAAEQGGTFPAKRTVREFALLEPPVEATAVVALVSGALTVDRQATVSGTDAAGSTACVVPTGNIGGAFAVGSVGTTGGNPISGSPATQTAASRTAAVAQLGVRWDILLGADVPVQYSSASAWPSFATMHADTFPLIRIQGDFSPTSVHNGRGALIVTGAFRPGSSFSWNGVVLAGSYVPNAASPSWTLRGLIVAGMDAAAGAVSIPAGSNLQYNRCNVMRAFAKLSHLEVMRGTGWTDR